MTTAELHYQMRFCNSCLTLVIDRAAAAYERGDADEGDRLALISEQLCNRYSWINALWCESQHNGLGRV